MLILTLGPQRANLEWTPNLNHSERVPPDAEIKTPADHYVRTATPISRTLGLLGFLVKSYMQLMIV